MSHQPENKDHFIDISKQSFDKSEERCKTKRPGNMGRRLPLLKAHNPVVI